MLWWKLVPPRMPVVSARVVSGGVCIDLRQAVKSVWRVRNVGMRWEHCYMWWYVSTDEHNEQVLVSFPHIFHGKFDGYCWG